MSTGRGENIADDRTRFRRKLLSDLFTGLDTSNTRYCVLRGFDQLFSGRGDVDILANGQDFSTIAEWIVNYCSASGLYTARVEVQVKSLYITIIDVAAVDGSSTQSISLHFVAFVSISAGKWQKAIKGFSTRYWIDEIEIRQKALQGVNFYAPSETFEFVFLVWHATTKFKETYKKRCLELLEVASVKAHIEDALGLDGEMDLSIALHDLEERVIDPEIIQRLLFPGKRRLRIATVTSLVIHFIRARFSRARLIAFFSGPDGAGKTTTSIEVSKRLHECGVNIRLVKNLYFLYRKTKVVGLLQSKIRNVDVSKKDELERDRGVGIAWKFRRLLGLLFIICQYVPGYFYARWLSKSKEVWIVETSVIDAFVKGHRPQFRWLENMALPLLPKGDLNIVLRASPAAIVARKPELTLLELESYYKRLDGYLVTGRVSPLNIVADRGVASATDTAFEEVLKQLHQTQVKRWIK